MCRLKTIIVFLSIILITACGGGAPDLKLLCENGDSKVLFETDMNGQSLRGNDGTSTKFYQDNFFEIVFVNFDESGNPIRVVNYYPADPGLEIIEGGNSKSWICKNVN